MQSTAVAVDELAEVVTDVSRHLAIWRCLVDPENHNRFGSLFKKHVDYFAATAEAHFQAVIVGTFQLMDSRADVVSLRTVLNAVRSSHGPLVADIEHRIAGHQEIFDRLSIIRHKVYAHRDARACPGLVVAVVDVSPNAIDACVDTLRAAVNDLYNAFCPGDSPSECYDEADHRARCATNDLLRMLSALSNNALERTRGG